MLLTRRFRFFRAITTLMPMLAYFFFADADYFIDIAIIIDATPRRCRRHDGQRRHRCHCYIYHAVVVNASRMVAIILMPCRCCFYASYVRLRHYAADR